MKVKQLSTQTEVVKSNGLVTTLGELTGSDVGPQIKKINETLAEHNQRITDNHDDINHLTAEVSDKANDIVIESVDLGTRTVKGGESLVFSASTNPVPLVKAGYKPIGIVGVYLNSSRLMSGSAAVSTNGYLILHIRNVTSGDATDQGMNVRVMFQKVTQ